MDVIGYSLARKVYTKLLAPPQYTGESTVTPYTPVPFNYGYGFAMASSTKKIIWYGNLTNSSGGTQFHSFDPATGTWTALATSGLAAGAFYNALMFPTEDKTAIHVLTNSYGWLRYNIVANTWTTINGATPGAGTGNPLGFRRPGTSQIYIIAQQNSSFNMFDDVAGTITTKAPFYVSPGYYSAGPGGAWNGGYFYALIGTGSKMVGKYDPVANSWTFPDTVQPSQMNYGALVSDGTTIYVLGNSNNGTPEGIFQTWEMASGTDGAPLGSSPDAIPDAVFGAAVFDPLVPGRIRWLAPGPGGSSLTNKHYIIDTQSVPDPDAATLLGWLAAS